VRGTRCCCRKRAKIVWDEKNLDANEHNKSATMKITEPKTPFNHEFDFAREVLGTETMLLSQFQMNGSYSLQALTIAN
jgi:hypothetical protein